MERRLSAESIPIFNEGIALVFNRWSALRTAVENEWGGRESRLKAQQIITDVLSWFTHSTEPLYIDDLENMLQDGLLSLNVEVDDGSIEEVAEKLMIMHEECLEGNFRSIEILREADLKQVASPHVTQVVNDNDEDSSDDEDSGNKIDEPMANVDEDSGNKINERRANVAAVQDDGWVVVSNRRNKGRKN